MSDSKLQSLSEIFNNKIFRIPDFQRGYSWEERQLDDFWEDIQNLSSDKIHYIGLLTVEPIKSCDIQNVEKWKDDLWLLKKGMSAYYVIDGQQRLTTLIILRNIQVDVVADTLNSAQHVEGLVVNNITYQHLDPGTLPQLDRYLDNK